jgi:Helix-turn-helix domain
VTGGRQSGRRETPNHDPIHPSRANRQLPMHHLNQIELARRWRISPRTLERWRWLKQGPPYLKIGGRVVYRLADIEAFEAAQAHG